MNWLRFSNHPIKTKIIEVKKGRNPFFSSKLITDKENLLPRSSVKEILSALKEVYPGDVKIKSTLHRDFQILEVIDAGKQLTDFGLQLVQLGEAEQEALLREKAALLPKVKILKRILTADPKTKSPDLLSKVPVDFFEGKLKSTKQLDASKALTWAKTPNVNDMSDPF